MKQDRWCEEFSRMVAFGESHVAGASATIRERAWVYRLKSLIDECQYKPVELINSGIGGDVLSTSNPVYNETFKGKRPIGIERYRKHVIEKNPDLVLIAYGYNDMRAGTPIDLFIKDYEFIIDQIKKNTNSLIVIIGTYGMPEGGYKNSRGGTLEGDKWNNGSRELNLEYEGALKELARRKDVLFSDVYGATSECQWLYCDPTGYKDIHAHDTGHLIIANMVFQTLAVNCSCLSKKALDERKRAGKSPWRHKEDGLEVPLIQDFYPDYKKLGQLYMKEDDDCIN